MAEIIKKISRQIKSGILLLSLLLFISPLSAKKEAGFTNIYADGIKQNSVRIHWTPTDNLIDLKIRIAPKVNSYIPPDWSTYSIEDIYTYSHIIDGLSPGKKYYYQVGTTLADGTEFWSKKETVETKPGFGLYEFFVLVGALAMFIFGMKVMSEGIQKFAGDRMKGILAAMTSNRISGVLTGFLTTSVIQSSSATTVMVVSFVNAKLLTLRQAIGVIMGANIGTTMTAWVLVMLGLSKFSLATYSLPILAFGLPMIFMRGSKTKALGEFLVGFALLFIGLNELKNAAPELSQDFLNSLQGIAEYGIFGIILFVFIGALLTIIVQSSSAAMALTLTLCNNGLPFEFGVAIVLGENIGTTITANLAALIGNVHAKRAAFAHLLFNVFGVIWVLLIFGLFTKGIDYAMINYTEWGSPYTPKNETGVTKGLAIFHTSFNIINTFILIWFVKFMEKTCVKFIKGNGSEGEFHLEYIGDPSLRAPEMSLLEVKKEISKHSKKAVEIPKLIEQLLLEHNTKKRQEYFQQIRKFEDLTDQLEVEVADYLAKMSTGNLTKETSVKLRGMLRIVSNLERIGDISYQMSKSIEKKFEERVWFTPEQRENMIKMLNLLKEALEIMDVNINAEDGKHDYISAKNKEIEINQCRNDLRQVHLEHMEKGKYNAKSGMVYSELFSSCERIGDHILNVSEAVEGIL
ncbi:MAG: Na/Pi symporter [Flavobacteriales bacterium]